MQNLQRNKCSTVVIIELELETNCLVAEYYTSPVPRPFEGSRAREGHAWGLLRAHARKIPFIFRIIRRKISDGEIEHVAARKEYANTLICIHSIVYSDCHATI